MKIADLPFGTVDWHAVERTIHAGQTGMAHWRTRHFDAEPHRSSTRTGAKLYVVD